MEKLFAYGFLDAEGCIHAGKNNAFRIQITSTNLPVLKEFFQLFGGNIYLQRSGVIADRFQRGVNRQCWCWALNGEDAARILRNALPYLIAHRIHAIEGLKFHETKRETSKIRLNHRTLTPSEWTKGVRENGSKESN